MVAGPVARFSPAKRRVAEEVPSQHGAVAAVGGVGEEILLQVLAKHSERVPLGRGAEVG
jgi:hypothetical protein